MDFLGNPQSLRLLQELLNPEEDSSQSEELFSKSGIQPTQSNQIEQQKSAIACDPNDTNQSSRYAQQSTIDTVPRSMEDWERQEDLMNDQELEKRLRPEYKITYKQAVRTEDIYLQMGNKTPATSSCEEMSIEIQMPVETMTIEQMRLDVGADCIDLKTSKYRLKLPLVQKIDPDNGKAYWDSDRKIMKLVLKMEREFDFVNF